MRPAVAVVSPLGVRPKVSVGNKGLAPVLLAPVVRGPVLRSPVLRSPDAAAFAAGPGLAPKAEGFDAVAAGAVVGRGNCPQLVARVGVSRVETGGAARVEVLAVVFAEVDPVNGGTGNDDGLAAVVDGNVVPFVAPSAEAAGSMGRPARSTF